MRYLDANVFIFAALDNGRKGKRAREILREVMNGMVAITSSITIDEVVWIIWGETGSREKAIEQGLRMLEFPNLKVISVGPEDTYHALNLMKKYQRLKPRDAIHLAVSLRAGVFRIISDDADFDDVDEIERERV